MSRPLPVHVLNGDALLEHFPETLTGKKLLMRECLIEGPVLAETREAFWHQRANFIQQAYGEAQEVYQRKVQGELEQLLSLPEGSSLHFWFEHDLFCQLNFWFCCDMIAPQLSKFDRLSLVHPLEKPAARPWEGFARHSPEDLLTAFRQRQQLLPEDVRLYAQLWQAYQHHEPARLQQLAESLKERFPYLPDVLAAQIERSPKGGGVGRPERKLLELKQQMPSASFAELFRAFSETEGIYGFGDAQLKRLLNQLAD
jgi:hypothetical protein